MLVFYLIVMLLIISIYNYYNKSVNKSKLINNSFVKPNNQMIFDFDNYSADKKITFGDNVVNNVMYTQNTIPTELNSKIINDTKDLIYDFNKLDNKYYYIKKINQLYIQEDKLGNTRYVLIAFIYDINNYYTLKIMIDYVSINNNIYTNSIGILEGSYYNILNRYDYTIFSRAYLGEYNTFNNDIINILDENYRKYYRKYYKLVGTEDTSLDFGKNKAKLTPNSQDDLNMFSNIYYPNGLPQTHFDPFCKKHLNIWDYTSSKIENPNIRDNCDVHNNSTLFKANEPYFAPGVVTQRVDMNDYSWMYQPYRANVASRSSENTFV